MKRAKEWEEPFEKERARSQAQQKKVKKNKEHFKAQRREMERIHNQKVKIICHKALLLPPGLFKSFTVRVNIPLRKDEIDKRMADAFPELPWRKS